VAHTDGVVYQHPHLGFAIGLPESGGVIEEEETRATLAVAGEGPDRPAIVTVQVQAIDPEWDSERFAAEALAAQAAVLGRLRVIDRERVLVDDLPAVRVLLQRRDDDGRAVVLEEWRIAQHGRGWTVSALCPIGSYWALAPLIGATAASFVPPDAVSPAPPRPGFDEDSGALTLSAEELTALTDLYEGRPADDEETGRALARLEEARLVEGGRPAPEVEAMLAVVSGATVKLTVQRPEPDAMAWLREGRAVLLLRLGAGGRQLVEVGSDRLPGILADLVDLGPRPEAAGREPMKTTVAELAEAFAPEPQATGPATELVAQRRSHWRIDARLSEPAGHAILEAIDAPGGWWLVRPEGHEVTLEPTTATGLFRHLTELSAA
jgi:hypothetical protein